MNSPTPLRAESEVASVVYGFPIYPGAKPLCQQRVYTTDGKHLDWQALTATDSPTEVVAWYTEHLGIQGLEANGTGGTWRVPPDARVQVLDVLPIAAPGPHCACQATPLPNAQTVIIISRRS
ncbi:MAG TPA: hypothetical protein VEW94_10720 [Chloroflexia bacterium]|nr:hypothetical protein [Chloroflexia bacterium]